MGNFKNKKVKWIFNYLILGILFISVGMGCTKNEPSSNNSTQSETSIEEAVELNKLQVLFTKMSPEFSREELETWLTENPDIFVNLVDYNGSDTYYLAFTKEDTAAKYKKTHGVALKISFEDKTNELENADYGDGLSSALFYNKGHYFDLYNKPAGFYIHKDHKEWMQVSAEEALEYQKATGYEENE